MILNSRIMISRTSNDELVSNYSRSIYTWHGFPKASQRSQGSQGISKETTKWVKYITW